VTQVYLPETIEEVGRNGSSSRHPVVEAGPL
jgi:hypothetical protein